MIVYKFNEMMLSFMNANVFRYLNSSTPRDFIICSLQQFSIVFQGVLSVVSLRSRTKVVG